LIKFYFTTRWLANIFDYTIEQAKYEQKQTYLEGNSLVYHFNKAKNLLKLTCGKMFCDKTWTFPNLIICDRYFAIYL